MRITLDQRTDPATTADRPTSGPILTSHAKATRLHTPGQCVYTEATYAGPDAPDRQACR
ncbi:MAG: hypothetical protein PHE53_10050 [Thermoguttaceae bacterium]|nr:hypothetical protein [Thermoguttaceae bacterium]